MVHHALLYSCWVLVLTTVCQVGDVRTTQQQSAAYCELLFPYCTRVVVPDALHIPLPKARAAPCARTCCHSKGAICLVPFLFSFLYGIPTPDHASCKLGHTTKNLQRKFSCCRESCVPSLSTHCTVLYCTVVSCTQLWSANHDELVLNHSCPCDVLYLVGVSPWLATAVNTCCEHAARGYLETKRRNKRRESFFVTSHTGISRNVRTSPRL